VRKQPRALTTHGKEGRQGAAMTMHQEGDEQPKKFFKKF
jgi:hypothetical protein